MDKLSEVFAPFSQSEFSQAVYDVVQDPRALEAKTICPPARAEYAEAAAARLFGRAPDGLWPYATPDRQAAFYVCRWNQQDGKKEIRPLSYVEGKGWAFAAWRRDRPLYRLDEISAKPNAPIVVCEGEKAADAAARIFPQSIATTSSGGANAAAKSDWTPLAGRRVLIWPDNDDNGRKYAGEVAAILAALGCDVSVIDAKALASLDPAGGAREPATKWDAANALAECSDLVALRKAAFNFAKAFDPPTVRRPEPTADWPELKPIQTSLPAVAPFDPELLPEALRGYVFDIASRQQSPPDFAAVAALCGLSTLIGNRARIQPKQFDDWQIVPNLWGAMVGAPSAMKSPALKAALPPIYALQDAMRKQWEAAQREAKADGAMEKLDARVKRKRAEKAFQQGGSDEARRLLAETAGDDQDPPPCPRVTINDATVEKLGELLNENPRGLLLIRDELSGFIARMEREEFQGERAFYLEAFSGDGQFTYDRIGRGTVYIEHCTLSIVGGVQPSRIAPLVRGAMSGKADDGLIQRFQLAVWPDASPNWIWVDRRPNAAARAAYEDTFLRLHDFTKDREQPAVFAFADDAQELFRTWMEEIQTEARGGKLPSSLESHLLKMPKTVCSLALIFHLVEGGDGPVSAEATARALDWVDYLRSHANRLYSSGLTQIEQGARLIIERREQLPDRFTARDVQRKAWSGIADKDAVADAIDLLIGNGYCREVPIAATTSGGRPTTAYEWNPCLKRER